MHNEHPVQSKMSSWTVAWLVVAVRLGSPFTKWYCMSKKSWPNLHGNLPYKIGQDFMDIQQAAGSVRSVR